MAIGVQVAVHDTDRHEFYGSSPVTGGAVKCVEMDCKIKIDQESFEPIGAWWTSRRRDHDVIIGNVSMEDLVAVEGLVAFDGIAQSVEQLKVAVELGN